MVFLELRRDSRVTKGYPKVIASQVKVKSEFSLKKKKDRCLFYYFALGISRFDSWVASKANVHG